MPQNGGQRTRGSNPCLYFIETRDVWTRVRDPCPYLTVAPRSVAAVAGHLHRASHRCEGRVAPRYRHFAKLITASETAHMATQARRSGRARRWTHVKMVTMISNTIVTKKHIPWIVYI